MTAPTAHLHRSAVNSASLFGATHCASGARRVAAQRRMYVQRRVAVLLLAVVTVVSASFVVAGNGGAHADLDPNAPVQTYRVRTGDTLWSIAGELSYPGDRRDAVATLAAANGSGDVVAGEDLIIPASLGSVR